jgi:hypothetical protein
MDHKSRLTYLSAVALGAVLGSASLAAGASTASVDPAAPLRFPVLDARSSAAGVTGYRPDKVVIRLSDAASRTAAVQLSKASAPGAAVGAGALRPRFARLGLPALDRATASLGAWLEPEFAGAANASSIPGAAGLAAFYLVHLPAGADLVNALGTLRGAAEVESAEPVAEVPLARVPNDSLWTLSWWLDQASGHDIHAPAAWDVTIGDTSVVVAVLDSGILRAHPDLGGVSGDAGHLWTNWIEAGGAPGVDDDHNGFIDDTWGWDFVSAAPPGGAASGEDAADEDNDPNDFLGHGSEVSGLIGAITDNQSGVSGVVWNARLMAVRVACATTAPGGGAVDMSDAAQGIDYAVRNGARVISCSFGTVSQPDLQAAVDEAIRNGVTVVMAAGNSSQSHDLADRSDVIAVAATDTQDQVASFSNTGAFVDLSAPGTGLTSTGVTHAGADSITSRTPAYVTGLNGTSFSTPLVSGAAALVQAEQRALGRHDLTPMGMLLRLRETADDISAQNPSASGYGTGRLNLERALIGTSGSAALRVGTPLVGPAVVLPGTSGRSALACVTADAHLLVLSSFGDTLAMATLPSTPARQLAAANLGPSADIGLFVGMNNGKVAGYDTRGNPLNGWPRGPASTLWPMSGGPALGDLDGDGVPEVVCGSGDGSVYAWHANGAAISGFPVFLFGGSINLPVALAPIDGNPGSEIVAVTDGGDVHVLDASGNDLPGWPVTVSGAPAAPLVTRLGSSGAPMIVVAAGNQVHAFDAGGNEKWSALLPGNVVSDPAAADLDQNGYDEILVPTLAPATLTVIDTAGVAWNAPGFPIALSATPAGPVVAGPLGAGGAPAALLMIQGGLAAFDAGAQPLTRFPAPGGAGPFPLIANLDGDGHSRVTAGSGPDSLLYIYDAGPGTWGTPASMWPAPRFGDARTGSRLDAPQLVPRDDVAPAAIADLAAGWVAPDSVMLHWTAPGDDGMSGTAAQYQMRVTALAVQARDFSLVVRTDLAAPAVAGTPERFAFATSAPAGSRLYFCLRALDEAGNAAAPSDVATLLLPAGGGTQVSTLAAYAVADSTVRLKWSAPGAALSGYQVRGARAPLDDASWNAAPLSRTVPAGGGPSDSLSIAGLEPGTTWWFAVRAVSAGGSAGPLSNVAAITVPMTGWLSGRLGVAIAPHTQPSRVPVQFDWQGVPPGGAARIDVFDLVGRKLRSFALERGRFGGSVQWNGRDNEQRAVPAGLYFARLTCGSIHAQTRVVLLP